MILVEDSGTGGPSSITVRMEYLLAFGGVGQKISFLFLWKKSSKSTPTGISRTWISVTSLKTRH